MKSIVAVILLVVSFFIYCIMLSGSHGNTNFRPQKTGDWIFWGLIISTGFTGGVMLLVQVIRLIRRKRFVMDKKIE
mgnify:CR=1 FL=1|jgi:ascorbate-specific PTS system EIIC-type component UlaA